MANAMTTALELVGRLDRAARFNPFTGVALETQTAHLSDADREAWRELRRNVDTYRINGEEAEAAVTAMEARLAAAAT